METFSNYCLTIIFIIVLTVMMYFKHSYDYWRKKGIPTLTPEFPFGNLANPFSGKEGLTTRVRKLYEEFRLKNVTVGGIYAGTAPVLMAVHPDFIKDILSKDFQYFASHGNTVNDKDEPLLGHLFNMEGERWKEMRVKLTPTFTSGKMKMMFQTLLDCGKQMKHFLDDHHKYNQTFDIKEISSCFTTDVIGSCAFGLDCDSFKNPDAEFRKLGRGIMTPTKKTILRRYVNVISPRLVKLCRLRILGKKLHDFFLNTVRDVVHYRQTKQVTRNDFMQILIDMENEARLGGKQAFTIGEMAAQAFVFFVAGFETSSTTMSFCLYELAHHQGFQDMLREEINETLQKYEGSLTYDGIMEMKYLDQVINETLRKYPPAHLLTRVCTRDYRLANGSTIERGTKVFISTLGLHTDGEYFPKPDDFVPDRFNDENKRKIRPYTFLPFGDGPRLCIGLRFAKMQIKVGLSLLLKDYKFFPEEGLNYPLEFHENSFILTSKDAVLLRTEKI